MNSYFTDVVGDEDELYLLLEHLKLHILESLLKADKIPWDDSRGFAGLKLDMCSCGSRQKHKCVKESESGYGKMCLKEE